MQRMGINQKQVHQSISHRLLSLHQLSGAYRRHHLIFGSPPLRIQNIIRVWERRYISGESDSRNEQQNLNQESAQGSLHLRFVLFLLLMGYYVNVCR
jgi:hypothetical protein